MHQDDSSSLLVTACLDQSRPAKVENFLLPTAGYFVVVAGIVSLIHSLDFFNICNVTLMLLLGTAWVIGCKKLTKLKHFVADITREHQRREAIDKESREILSQRDDRLSSIFRNSQFLVGAVESEGGMVKSLFENSATQQFFANLILAGANEPVERAETIHHWIRRYLENCWIKTPVSFEHEFVTYDGPRWLAVTISQAGQSAADNRFCYFAEEITIQKKAQKAVTQTHEQVTDILDAHPDAIFSLDSGWRLTFMNSQAISVLGHGREILGRVFWDVFPDLAGGEIWNEYSRAMLERVPVEFDVFQAGDERFEVRALPCRGGLAVFLRNVTRERQTIDLHVDREKQLRRHLADLERHCQTAPMCLAVFDSDLRFVRVNETMAELSGVRIDATLGRRLAHVAPYWYDCIAPTLKCALQSGRTAYAQVVNSKRNANEPWHDCGITAHPLYDDADSIVGVSLTLVDITAEQRAERILRESEQRFRQLADSLPDIIWTAEPSGKIDYCNLRWYAYTNCDTDQTAEWSRFIHPTDLEIWQESWAKCMLGGKRYEMAFQLLRHDGMYRWFLCRAQGIVNSEGEVLKWVGTCTDIHEDKHIELALEHSNRDLRQLAAATTQDLKQLNAVNEAGERLSLSLELGAMPVKAEALSNGAWRSAKRMDH